MDPLQSLRRDHSRLEELFEEYERHVVGHAASRLRRDLGCRLAEEITIHAALEEESLYPLLRETLPGGDPLADKSLGEHRTIKTLVREIETLRPTGKEFDDRIRALRRAVQLHVEEEESVIFPHLQERLDQKQKGDFAERFARAKQLVDSAPVAEVADEVRERLERRPAHSASPPSADARRSHSKAERHR